jgi:hypothetical protein
VGQSAAVAASSLALRKEGDGARVGKREGASAAIDPF